MNELERRWKERERAEQGRGSQPADTAAEPAPAPETETAGPATPLPAALPSPPPPSPTTATPHVNPARALSTYAAASEPARAAPAEQSVGRTTPSGGTPAAPLAQGASEASPAAPAPSLSRQSLSRQEKVRLLLAALAGALVASIVFLSIELVRRRGAAENAGAGSASASAGLVAVDPLTGRPVAPPAAGAPQDPLAQMFQRMAQGMGRAFQGGGTQGFTFSFGGDDAAIEFEEDGDALVVVAKVKDAIADKLDVQIQGNMFTLRGQRRLGSGGAMSFQKSVSLPVQVDASKMTQSFKDGELRVRLPKKR